MRAVAGLSGGVDSAVAAMLAINEGWDLVGVTLLFPGVSAEPARAVCRSLGIEHHAVEAGERFERCVLREFVDGWARGLTPNPCVECNPRVKFALLLDHANALGRERIVSGHYARVARAGQYRHLLRAVDRTRDQSYMLHRLPQGVLERLFLPLGDLTKREVRRRAAEAGLAAANRPDSQDICFAQDEELAELIGRHRPEALQPGPIVDVEGREIGRHRGLARYTIGQRRGLGIGGAGGPFFVLRIEPERNALVVGAEEDLWVEQADVERLHPIGEVRERAEGAFEASVMTRYRGRETEATVEPREDRAVVHFHRPHRAPAPGQSAVFYESGGGDRCLGGGVIARPHDRGAE